LSKPVAEVGFQKDIDSESVRYRYHKSGNPYEEALMIQELMRDRTQKEVSIILDISQGQISKRLRLLSLLPELQKMLLEDKLKPSTAYALSKLPTKTQKDFLSRNRITLKEAEAARRQQIISKELMEHLTEPRELPTGEWKKARKKPVVVEFREVKGKREKIKTKEGVLVAVKGRDYVIRGVEGEIYPIAKEIFEQTYDVV